MSDGLIAPANAPYGTQTPVGIQPGSTGTVLAQFVILFGPGPAIFVYNGTPGLGTLVGSWAAVAGTDRFGNPYLKDFTVYGSNGSYINVNDSGGIGGNTAILFHPGGTSHVTEQPQVYGASNNTGLANEFEFLNLVSGAAASLDDAQLQLLSERADASVGAVFNFLIGGTLLSQLFKTVWNIGVPISCTLGTAANPTIIVTDSWHAITLDANWSTLGGQPAPAYRLLPDGTVELIGAIQFNANIANTNINGGVPLPAQYRPITQTFIAGAPGAAGVSIQTNGVLVAASAALVTTFCNFNGTYPLNH